jgi:signal peptidase II
VRIYLASAYVRAALVLAVVLVLDQVSKHLVRNAIVPGERIAIVPGIHLVRTSNHGVAFGLEAGNQVLVTVLVALALVALLAYFVTHASRPLIWLPTGMLLGGALGNLLDRVRTGSVTDFIQLPLGWPPFNLADVSIVLGVALLLFVIESPNNPGPEPSAPR